jgi:hypothetical protein
LEPGLELEERVLLSARAAAMTNARHARAAAARVTPAAEINAQYSAFANDFATVEQLYVTAINEQSTGTVSVTATVTALIRLPRPRCRSTMPLCFSPTVQRHR